MNVPRSIRRMLAAVAAVAPLTVLAACSEARSAADRLQAVVSAESTARDALITIRRAAQDWKNLLLRGRDASEREAMQRRLDAQARSYEERLATLRDQLWPLGLELDRARLLEDERRRMFERYGSALAHHGVATLDAAVAADREARGADVATFRALEQVIDVVAARARVEFENLRAAIDRCGVAREEVAR